MAGSAAERRVTGSGRGSKVGEGERTGEDRSNGADWVSWVRGGS